MTLDEIQQICKSLENVTVEIKWCRDRVLLLSVTTFGYCP